MLKLLKNLTILRDGKPAAAEILVADRRIAAVGPRIGLSWEGLETIDCGGMTAIPGYLDQHVHVTGKRKRS